METFCFLKHVHMTHFSRFWSLCTCVIVLSAELCVINKCWINRISCFYARVSGSWVFSCQFIIWIWILVDQFEYIWGVVEYAMTVEFKPPPNLPLWHEDFCELKATKKQIQEKLSTLPSSSICIKAGHKFIKVPPFPSLAGGGTKVNSQRQLQAQRAWNLKDTLY